MILRLEGLNSSLGCLSVNKHSRNPYDKDCFKTYDCCQHHKKLTQRCYYLWGCYWISKDGGKGFAHFPGLFGAKPCMGEQSGLQASSLLHSTITSPLCHVVALGCQYFFLSSFRGFFCMLDSGQQLAFYCILLLLTSCVSPLEAHCCNQLMSSGKCS